MIKQAVAVALLGAGLGLVGQMPAGAMPLPASSFAASPATQADHTLLKVGGRCFELPVVGAAVAFFELLRDEEFDRHCDRHFDGDSYYRHSYDERSDLSTKDTGYRRPHRTEKSAPAYK